MENFHKISPDTTYVRYIFSTIIFISDTVLENKINLLRKMLSLNASKQQCGKRFLFNQKKKLFTY